MPDEPTSADKYRRLVTLEREAARLRAELEAIDRSGPPRILDEDGDPEVWELLARFGSDFLSLHSASGTYRYASPSVRGLFGWAPEDLVGTSAYDYFHPEDLERIAANHEAHIDVDPVDPVVYRFRCRDGSWRWVETRSKAYRSEDGVGAIISITRDVTEQREAAEAREELVRELQDRLEQIEALEGLLPMCAWCGSVRDDDGYWDSVERYLERRGVGRVTHSICPACERAEGEP